MPLPSPSPVPARGERAAIAVLVLAALVLAFANLWREGWYTDPYFAAAVRSMGASWHDFFFVSFDPAGFLAVDKPPLALWLQTALVRVLGFHDLVLLLPATLAGLGSIALIAYLVRRAFGTPAALAAAACQALMPVAVAGARSNNMDSLLTCTSLLGAWAIARAAETGRLRPLLLCAVALALGFDAKLLQAYIVAPAFILLYLLSPLVPRRTRLVHLALAGMVLLILSFAWVAAVDLTPADQRPFVGSSSNNTAMDLVFGYNGLGRITGGSAVASAYAGQVGNAPGDPGPLRLFNAELGGQIGWLLPLALAGLAAAAAEIAGERAAAGGERRSRAKEPPAPLLGDRRGQALVLLGGWLLSLCLLYSLANFFHPYNLVVLSPAISALAGIGAGALWRLYSRRDALWWLLPVALAATAAGQVAIILESPDWLRLLLLPVAGLALLAAAWLALARPRPRVPASPLGPVAAAGLASLLLAPALWASVPVWHYGLPEFPIAGPALLDPGVELPSQTRASLAPPSFTRYLVARHHGERFLLAARYGGIAAPVMLATGGAVLDYGGYLGEDRILSTDQLVAMIGQRRVRFFWMLNQQAEAAHQDQIEGWVARRCGLVPPADWQPRGAYGPAGPRLFDCGLAAAHP